MTVNFTCTFAKPYKLGLLVKKSDRLHIDVAMSESEYGGDVNGKDGLWLSAPDTYSLGNVKAKHRLEMIFDFDNEVMKTMRSIARNTYWVLIGMIVAQIVLLSVRGVDLLLVWIFIEYLQLISFMPISNFNLIPYLYDAFRPSLVTHAILLDDTPLIDDGLDNDYFDIYFENYWLSNGKLF